MALWAYKWSDANYFEEKGSMKFSITILWKKIKKLDTRFPEMNAAHLSVVLKWEENGLAKMIMK